MTTGDDVLLARLAELGAATVHEAIGGIGAADHGLKPLDPATRVAGRAVTHPRRAAADRSRRRPRRRREGLPGGRALG